MNNEFIGRMKEIKRLDECMESNQAQLIVVYGRRRVGKTFLIENYYDNNFAFSFTGAFNQPKSVQLNNFADELSFQMEEHVGKIPDWHEAFLLLRKYLSSLNNEKKQVVFFDELPWMDTHKSDFLPSFEWFWNSWGSKQNNLVMIVCGSATSWMSEHISDNKGGLFNRHTCRMYLEPFNLKEVESLLENRGFMWSRRDIAECYMIMGGMPYYLNLLRNDISMGQNIDELFFKRKGELWDEFSHLYNTLFSGGENYIKVVELLSKKRMGLTRKEIAEANVISSSSMLSKILKDLETSGFIRIYSFYGHKKREQLYQLCDYYSLFYFRFIKDNYGIDEMFWSRSYDNSAINVWRGISFEMLCKDHIQQIKNALGISGVFSEESIWYVKSNGMGDEKKGAQIDMLIDRRDNAINICEMKFYSNEFDIDKDYDHKLRDKIATFKKCTNSRKSLILTMITSYGVKKNKYSGIVSSEVVLDDLFLF